ncbi:MAG: hypothetical protein LKF42_09110 [Streptococcaceae bacterium]|nr:hypothetical protein [Streptococcaceae bacterium]
MDNIENQEFATFRELRDFLNQLSDTELDNKIGNAVGGGELGFTKAKQSDENVIYIF